MYRKLLLNLIIIVFLLPMLNLASYNLQAQDDDEESSCITCHTSAVKLIKITREIQKKNPPKEKSELSKGEG